MFDIHLVGLCARLASSANQRGIGCDRCRALLDGFPARLAAGEEAAETTAAVQKHLEACPTCRIVFAAQNRNPEE
jgi:predicted anti-sigma-YlaC factor YlaD